MYRILLFIVFASLLMECENDNVATIQQIESVDLEKDNIPLEVDYKSSIPISDTLDASALGRLLFFKRTSISRVACADCHAPNKSFYAPVAHAAGGGDFRTLYKKEFHRFFGEESDIPEDVKPVKSPTSLNTFFLPDRVLWDGLQDSFPLEFQFGKAKVAHFMDDLVLECQHDYLLSKLSNSAFGEGITESTVAASLSIFQQGLLSNQSNIVKYINGESKRIHGAVDLFDKHCYSCHYDQPMKRGISSDNLVKTPMITNVKDSPCFFKDCQEITLYQAIKKHQGIHTDTLTRSEIYAIKRFIERDLHDPNLKRYAK